MSVNCGTATPCDNARCDLGAKGVAMCARKGTISHLRCCGRGAHTTVVCGSVMGRTRGLLDVIGSHTKEPGGSGTHLTSRVGSVVRG